MGLLLPPPAFSLPPAPPPETPSLPPLILAVGAELLLSHLVLLSPASLSRGLSPNPDQMFA
jgi:hypothetical protein